MTATPETVQQLLELQEPREEDINFQELACKALLKCTAEQSAQVAALILETLRDWHLQQCQEADNPLPWCIDATRLDVALKTLNLVSW